MVARIKVNQAEILMLQYKLRNIKNGLPKVMSRGINKTGAAARTQIVNEINKEVMVKKKAIRRGIDYRKATYKKWQATIDVSGKRLPLGYFSPSQLKTGVSYKINREEGRKKIKYDTANNRVFMNTLGTGHKGLFKRLPGHGRLPIIELYGPSLPRIFTGAAGVAKRVIKDTNSKLKTNIDTQVKVLLKQAK